MAQTTQLSYSRYLKIFELLELQEKLSPGEAHNDEMHFIIAHQSYELWFKLMLHELDEVRTLLQKSAQRESVVRVLYLLRRVNAIQKHLVSQVHLLETMSPAEFNRFREQLRPASGFQSYQFRELEFIGGLKDKSIIQEFVEFPEVMKTLERRFNEPSLGDIYYDVLRARGLKMPAGDSDEAREQRLQSLAKLAEEEPYSELHRLGEEMVEWDEWFSLWRSHHAKMAERMIGNKRGTGGSRGAEYLRKTTEKRFFPELWESRTMIVPGAY
jgi:tryptophan 2,3-dioxygenase